MASLFATLRKRFAFEDHAAIAAELDPRSLTTEWIRTAVDLGLNRASLGVQDLDPRVQAAINRVQPFDMVERSVEALRDAGVESINLDLMYGLPRQTTHGLVRTIDQVVTLKPDRLALFGYAHVPWMMPRQRLIGDDDLPGARQRYQQQLVAANKLQEAGYVPIGLDHFALPSDDLAIAAANGFLGRSFQGYTSEGTAAVIGLGASAISSFEAGFAQNSPDVPTWQQSLANGRFATSRGIELSAGDRFRAAIIRTLMCDLEVDFASLFRKWELPRSTLAPHLDRLEALEVDGLVRLYGSVLAVTRLGRPFLRTVCATFDQYLPERGAAPHHARAI